MTRPLIYFVRHGETDWNAKGRLQGQRDIALNARGRTQATRCGAMLRRLLAQSGRTPEGFDYVSSPLMRARTTMELMREALGLAPCGYAVDRRLIEMSFGDWEGWTAAEVRTREPQALAAREADRWRFAPPRGESYAQLAVRIGAWTAQLTRDTIVAGHGEAGRALLVDLGFAAQETKLARLEQNAVYVLGEDAVTRHDAPA